MAAKSANKQGVEKLTIKHIKVHNANGEIIEATKQAANEPWHICYPTGDERFYGTREEVQRRIANRIQRDAHDNLDPV